MTKAEQLEHRKRAEWLSSAGVPIEVPDALPAELSALDVLQYGPDFNDVLFNRYPGMAFVVVGLKLIARRTKITVDDCRIISPWRGPEFFLWGAGREDLNYDLCKGLGFFRDEVLNHKIEQGLSLRRGVPAEGVVIASCFETLPEHYKHGSFVTINLEFIDQLGSEYPLEAQLRVNLRIGEMERLALPRRRGGLFDLSDTELATHEPERSQMDICRESHRWRPHGKNLGTRRSKN